MPVEGSGSYASAAEPHTAAVEPRCCGVVLDGRTVSTVRASRTAQIVQDSLRRGVCVWAVRHVHPGAARRRAAPAPAAPAREPGDVPHRLLPHRRGSPETCRTRDRCGTHRLLPHRLLAVRATPLLVLLVLAPHAPAAAAAGGCAAGGGSRRRRGGSVKAAVAAAARSSAAAAAVRSGLPRRSRSASRRLSASASPRACRPPAHLAAPPHPAAGLCFRGGCRVAEERGTGGDETETGHRHGGRCEDECARGGWV